MTVREGNGEALDALDVAYARAVEVVDPYLLSLVSDRIDIALRDADPLLVVTTDRDRAVCAAIDQMLIDVARLDNATVEHAASFFPDGEFADLVMASYIIEARTRLAIAADRLLGGVA